MRASLASARRLVYRRDAERGEAASAPMLEVRASVRFECDKVLDAATFPAFLAKP
jgi:hypothetical protein